MIQIYKSTNLNFSMNGDATLQPIDCSASFIFNGPWEIEITNPLDKNFSLIEEEAVLAVPTPYGDKQLYRIYKKIKTMDYIKAYARNIFMDAKHDCFLFDVRPTNKTGQDALNMMVASNCKYSAKSDISKAATSYYVRKNLIAAINGDDENSFINRWGGEISYDNYEISINERIGADNGLRAEFGYNLEEIDEEIDLTNVVTRIVPVAYNGHTLPNNETVDSPLINNFKVIRNKEIKYDDIKLVEDANETDADNGITVCETLDDLYDELRKRANLEYENGIDKPSATYTVRMINLRDSELYKKYKCLETVNLGDTVYCKNKNLGIETVARVIELHWNCITKKIESLVLGNFKRNIFNEFSNTINSVSQVINKNNNTLMAEKISGIINLLNASMRAQKNVAQKQEVRAILFEDIDKDSPTYGALCIGTQGIQLAKERNETDTDWKWGTAIDFRSINADYMITGILTDQAGKFYLNMNTGELNMQDGTFVGKITGSIIEGSQFIVTQERTIEVTQDDVDKIRDYIMGNITLTDEEIKRLDVSMDGYLSPQDYVLVRNILNGILDNVAIDKISIYNDKMPIIELLTKLGTQEFRTKLTSGAVYTDTLFTLNNDGGYDNLNPIILRSVNPIVETWTGYNRSGAKIYARHYFTDTIGQGGNATVNIDLSDLNADEIWIDNQNSFARLRNVGGTTKGMSTPVNFVSKSGWYQIWTSIEGNELKIYTNANTEIAYMSVAVFYTKTSTE